MALTNADAQHFAIVKQAVNKNRLVPFLGAGVNLASRPEDHQWTLDSPYLPTGAELSQHLANIYQYPATDRSDLLRVSNYAAIKAGSAPLYLDLHQVFEPAREPTSVHHFLAELPAQQRAKNGRDSTLIVVTTNYDNLMEQAFDRRGEQYDVLTYLARGDSSGKFRHKRPDGKTEVIDHPNESHGLPDKRRHLILKIHGTVAPAPSDEDGDPPDDDNDVVDDSYVITEDNYIDFLARTDLSALIPATLLAALKQRHFLFLGYSLRDWNIRAILRRFWEDRSLTFKSWSVQRQPPPLECVFWEARDVDIIDMPLGDYINKLQEHLQWSAPLMRQ